MPNVKPISDFKNYNEALQDIAVGGPVFLTDRNNEYEKLKASQKLKSQLVQGEQAGKEKGWMTIEEVEAELGIDV